MGSILRGGTGAGAPHPAADYDVDVKTFWHDKQHDFDPYFDAALAAGSPFASVTPYDPDEDIDYTQSRFDEFDTVVSALAATTDFASFVTQATTSADASVGDTTDITAVVDAFEEKSTGQFLRETSRFEAGMNESYATSSSAFVLGKAILERSFANDVLDFRARLTLQVKQQRAAFIMQGVDGMSRMLAMQVSAEQAAAHLQAELNRIKIVTKKEEIAEEISFLSEDATWELELFQHSNNIISSLNGAALIPKAPSVRASMLSGALSGLSAGIATGNPAIAIGLGIFGAFAGRFAVT